MVKRDYGKYLISAIVSTYNAEKFIRGRLEDLEAQTIADKLEVIVVDSGSEQNEGEIVKEFQRKYSNIKYIRTEQRESIYAAWNRGIRSSSGKYITNTNADDRLRKDALEIMANTVEEMDDVGIVYIDQIITEYPNETFEEHHTNGFLNRPDFFKEIIVNRNPCGPQVMWRRYLHKLIGYFKDDYEVAGDWEFWLRAVFNTSYTVYHIPEFLGLYYRNKEGLELGGRKQKERLREIAEIKREYSQKNQYPLCSIIVNHDSGEKTLKLFVDTLERNTPKELYELVIIYNNQRNPNVKLFSKMRDMLRRSLNLFQGLSSKVRDDIKIIKLSDEFNFLKALRETINGFNGKYVAFLTSNILVSKRWLEQNLLLFEEADDIGIVRLRIVSEVGIDERMDILDRVCGVLTKKGHVEEYLRGCENEFKIEYLAKFISNKQRVSSCSG